MGNEAAVRFHQAEAKYRRQKNRFFSGVVGSWQSPYQTGRDGSSFCDSAFAKAQREYSEALAALTTEQVWKYVDGLTEKAVKARHEDQRQRKAQRDLVEAASAAGTVLSA